MFDTYLCDVMSFLFFFFKQKTTYDVRISDWSSDVCSSDLSIWLGGQPVFAGSRYADLSETALHYIGGLLRHAPALMALCAPPVNSYHRLVPGFEAPVNLAYSQRKRSAACRIPMYSPSTGAQRVEFRRTEEHPSELQSPMRIC